MKKTYVIDTNVLIQNPHALHCFEDNSVVLPLVVVEELDALKKTEGEKGSNARSAVRILESYRMKGDLLKGVRLEAGGTIRIEKNFVDVELPSDLPEDKADNRILKVCLGIYQQKKRGQQIILVTKDIVLRLKAQILGIPAEDFTTEQISEDDLQYTGRIKAYIPEECVKEFKKHGISRDMIYSADENGEHYPIETEANEFVILTPDQSSGKTLLGRIQGEKVIPLHYKKVRPYGVKPQNVGQYFMQEALMLPAKEIPLVIIKGMAGTAKTFYSLAVGMEKVYNNPSGEYRRIIVCRSIVETYLIIDEAQNMTPNQVKGIITRAGKGTKIILLGDPLQIDKPFLDEKTNGLSYAAKCMKGSPYCCQITLSAEECERSALAMDAINRL